MAEDKPLISPKEAAERFPYYSEGTLANLRHKKKGPPYYKRGNKIFYDPQQYEAWLRGNPVKTIESI